MKINQNSGFSLVEVAVVLVIGGLLIAAFSAYVINFMTQAKIKTTQTRIEQVSDALKLYAGTNRRLPCVASRIAALDTPAYGREVALNCAAAPSGAANGNIRTPSAVPGRFVRIGMVPTRDLNLPDEYGYDAWGSRLIYAVAENQTATYDPASGAIGLIDSGGNSIVTPANSATFVVVSVGSDRKGGYTNAGGLTEDCMAAGVVGLDVENCNEDSIFRQTLITATQAGANFYNDYIAYAGSVSAPPPPCVGGVNDAVISEFTTSGTWAVPPNMQYMEIEMYGAGGGGGACRVGARINPDAGRATCSCRAGTGGAGGYVRDFIRSNEITASSINITIGTGGNPGTCLSGGGNCAQSRKDGQPGTQTSFGNILALSGGQGGVGIWEASSRYGDVNVTGTAAPAGTATGNPAYYNAGTGGGSPASGTASDQSGSGSCDVFASGGAGSNGRVFITAYVCQ